MSTLAIEPHPLLAVFAFETTLPAPVGALPPAPGLGPLLASAAAAPVRSSDEIRERVRKMLRHGGYKPSGRGKPASEYLLRAAEGGSLGTINPVVDACNVASLHSGFPVSVVDLDRTRGALSIRLGVAGESYVFNASGQTIDLEGLLVLCDEEGPSANAVKDAQRTKTNDDTSRTLSIVWGTQGDEAHLQAAGAWYRALVHDHLGAKTTEVSSSGSRSEPS